MQQAWTRGPTEPFSSNFGSGLDLNIPPSCGSTEAEDVHRQHFGPQAAVCREASDALRRGKEDVQGGNYNKALFYDGSERLELKNYRHGSGIELKIRLASHGMYRFEH